MMFPLSVQFYLLKMPPDSSQTFRPAVLSAGSSARMFKIMNYSRGSLGSPGIAQRKYVNVSVSKIRVLIQFVKKSFHKEKHFSKN